MTDGYRGSTAGECERFEPTVWAIRFRKGIGLPFLYIKFRRNI